MVDIRSPRAGVIDKYFSGQGDVVQVNGDFYVIETDGKPGAGSASKPAEAQKAQEEKKQEAPKQASAP